jgi:hypothetical protein
MTRLAAKTLSVLAVAAALALAGCGGDDDSGTTTTGGDTTSAGDTPQQLPDDLSPQAQKKLEQLRRKAEQLREAKQDASGEGKSTTAVHFREPTGPAPTSSGSLPNEGSKNPAPGVPLARGGDNSIQTFGVEAPSADRVAASRVFQAYLDARLAGDWALACSYLSGPTRTQLEQFGGQAGRGGSSDCAQVMRAFTEGVPKEVLRNAADIRVLSMRVEGGQAFLIYRDGEGLPSSVPMNEEGGAWKVAAIAGSALFLGV